MEVEKEKIVVFASGTKAGGGTGFEKLFEYAQGSGSSYTIAAVVSNHERGGVYGRAMRLDVPFEFFPSPWDAASYRAILEKYGAKWAVLSGWMKFVVGLDPAHTINIHPALLSILNGRFGGPGMYGPNLQAAVANALEAGELGDSPKSGFTMHFVVDGGGDKALAYDKGPVICEVTVPIKKGMPADEIGRTVNRMEKRWQPMYTDMVISGKIRLEEGKVVTPATTHKFPGVAPIKQIPKP